MFAPFLAAVVAFGQGPVSTIIGHRDPKVYADTWNLVSQSVTEMFYARSTRKAEMERLLSKYGPLASDAKDDEEFEARVEDMIHEFGDSHFDLFTKGDQGFYLMDAFANGSRAAKAPDIGAWFRRTPDGYRVQMVLEGTEAARAELRAGDRILSADGEPFGPITSFFGKEGMPVSLLVERGASRFERTVTPKSDRVLDMFLKATNDSARIIDAKGKKIAYVHLWTLSNANFSDALTRLVNRRFASTDAFILDLRDGFGGSPGGYAEPFFLPGDVTSSETGGSVSAYHFGYPKPLVVLINGGSRSAKEILSFVFKHSHRATLIGSRTSGSVLVTGPISLNDWSYLEMPLLDLKVDGVRLEKNGVQPDIRIPDGFDKDGKDVVIERAVQFLTRR